MDSRSTVDARGRFGLAWALALSILFHALLGVLSVWFPFTRSAAVIAADREEETITFRFAENVEPTTDDPRQDTPYTPFEPRPNEALAPVPLPDLPETAPIEPSDAEPWETPVEEQIPAETPPEEPAPAETVEQSEPRASDLRERPDGIFRRSPEASSTPDRKIDMQEALRDFARAMGSRTREPRAPQPAQAVQPHVIVPDLSRIPYSGYGVGNLVFESQDFDWTDYGRQIYIAIWRAWHNRLWLTSDDFEKWAHRNANWRLDHSTRVRFVIERNGQVTGILQETGSGCDPLDASTLDALAEVILPPLPDAFPRDREVVHAHFLARGQIQVMRTSLGRMKAAGYF